MASIAPTTLAFTLAACAALAAAPARADTGPTAAHRPGEDFIEVGAGARLIQNMRLQGETFLANDGIAVTGFDLGVGHRLGEDFVLEGRVDVAWDSVDFTASGRVLVLLDPGWQISPIIGPWLGYRYARTEFDQRGALLVGPDPDPDLGITTGHDVTLGAEMGLRFRDRRFVASLALQWGTALWSTRRVSFDPANPPREVPEAVDIGDNAELGAVARLGVRW